MGSIFASWVIARGGLKWMRQDNGQSINFWEEHWLKSVENALISTTASIGLENLQVSDIIDHDTQTRRMDIIDNILS